MKKYAYKEHKKLSNNKYSLIQKYNINIYSNTSWTKNINYFFRYTLSKYWYSLIEYFIYFTVEVHSLCTTQFWRGGIYLSNLFSLAKNH